MFVDVKCKYLSPAAKKFKGYQSCCLEGTDSNPILETCTERTKKLQTPHKQCKGAFLACCKFAEEKRKGSVDVSLARSGILWLSGTMKNLFFLNMKYCKVKLLDLLKSRK